MVPDSLAVTSLRDAARLLDGGYALVDSACQVFRLEADGVTPRWVARITGWLQCVAVVAYPTPDTVAVVGQATDTTVGVALIDSAGQMLWSGSYVFFPPPAGVHPRDAVRLPSGDLMVVGWLQEGSSVAFAYLLTSTGVPAQLLTYHLPDTALPTRIQRAARLSTGDILLVGSAVPDTVDPGDLWMFAVDAGGNPVGDALLAGTPAREEAFAVLPTSDGGVLMGGEQQDATDTRGILIQLDPTGQVSWVLRAGQAGSLFHDVGEMGQTYLAVGEVGGDGLVAHVLSGGSVAHVYRYGSAGADLLARVFSLPDGWLAFGATHDTALPRASVFAVGTDSTGESCNPQTPPDTSQVGVWNLQRPPVTVSGRGPDLAVAAAVESRTATVQVICSGTSVDEGTGPCRSSSLRVRMIPGGVRLPRAMGYEVFSVDGRRIRRGLGQTILLPRGRYRIRTPEGDVGVVVP